MDSTVDYLRAAAHEDNLKFAAVVKERNIIMLAMLAQWTCLNGVCVFVWILFDSYLSNCYHQYQIIRSSVLCKICLIRLKSNAARYGNVK